MNTQIARLMRRPRDGPGRDGTRQSGTRWGETDCAEGAGRCGAGASLGGVGGGGWWGTWARGEEGEAWARLYMEGRDCFLPPCMLRPPFSRPHPRKPPPRPTACNREVRRVHPPHAEGLRRGCDEATQARQTCHTSSLPLDQHYLLHPASR